MPYARKRFRLRGGRARGTGGSVDRGTVLVVDDEPAILASLVQMFGEEYVLRTAGDPGAALKLLAREPAHVVISDYKMPGMDGISFLVEVKRRHPEVVRVLMTAFADMSLVIRAMNEGEIHRFLSKPYKSFEFRRILDEALELARLVGRRDQSPRGRTVLVAHDSQITQASLRLLLTPAYQVLTTASGIEALAILASRRIDGLVTGVGLEMLDGCSIVSYLKREKRSPMPLAIWGSGVSGPYAEYLRECGADLVLDDADPAAAERLQQFLNRRLA